MTSDLSTLRDSVENYWHNHCDVFSINDDITAVIHKIRNTVVYIGQWNMVTNLPHGKGKQYKSIGKCDRDEGLYINKKLYLYGKVSHKGIWNNGLFEGFGFHWYPNGTLYKGNWLENKPHGYGVFYNANKEIEQKGTWHKGMIHNGFGKKLCRNQTYFLGDIINGYITENGKFYNMYDNKIIV
jgi:hypothetical protein